MTKIFCILNKHKLLFSCYILNTTNQRKLLSSDASIYCQCCKYTTRLGSIKIQVVTIFTKNKK